MPYRGTLCAGYEVCPVRDCSAPVVPRQEEFSGAATEHRAVKTKLQTDASKNNKSPAVGGARFVVLADTDGIISCTTSLVFIQSTPLKARSSCSGKRDQDENVYVIGADTAGVISRAGRGRAVAGRLIPLYFSARTPRKRDCLQQRQRCTGSRRRATDVTER